jgi:hypothetical protein
LTRHATTLNPPHALPRLHAPAIPSSSFAAPPLTKPFPTHLVSPPTPSASLSSPSTMHPLFVHYSIPSSSSAVAPPTPPCPPCSLTQPPPFSSLVPSPITHDQVAYSSRTSLLVHGSESGHCARVVCTFSSSEFIHRQLPIQIQEECVDQPSKRKTYRSQRNRPCLCGLQVVHEFR